LEATKYQPKSDSSTSPIPSEQFYEEFASDLQMKSQVSIYVIYLFGKHVNSVCEETLFRSYNIDDSIERKIKLEFLPIGRLILYQSDNFRAGPQIFQKINFVKSLKNVLQRLQLLTEALVLKL
jgi:hypothetical protein